MKFHKIRGVAKSVCTAEQKIAYNCAWSNYDMIMRQGLTVDEYIASATRILQANENIIKKYDIDAIIHCLRQGIVNYCKSSNRILTSYEEVGKMFPSLYPVE